MEAAGKQVAALDERPELTPIDLYYLGAFGYLSPMRQMGMGQGAIPIGSCIEYHEVFDGPHPLRTFCRIIRAVDSAYLIDQQETK